MFSDDTVGLQGFFWGTSKRKEMENLKVLHIPAPKPIRKHYCIYKSLASASLESVKGAMQFPFKLENFY